MAARGRPASPVAVRRRPGDLVGIRDVSGLEASILTTASRVEGDTVACFSSSPAMCSRKSSVDQSVFADPRTVNLCGRRSASARPGDGGHEQAAGQVARRPEEDHALDHVGRLSLAAAGGTRRRWHAPPLLRRAGGRRAAGRAHPRSCTGLLRTCGSVVVTSPMGDDPLYTCGTEAAVCYFPDVTTFATRRAACSFVVWFWCRLRTPRRGQMSAEQALEAVREHGITQVEEVQQEALALAHQAGVALRHHPPCLLGSSEDEPRVVDTQVEDRDQEEAQRRRRRDRCPEQLRGSVGSMWIFS